jgi:DNA-binding transcriptional LysR family regulator
MELRQLEYFVAVAEEANFTRAAQRVHISQSGVSAQVRQLERELGADLIDRSTRTATLTAAGGAALAPARAALAQVAAFAIVGVATEVGIEPTVRHGADRGLIPVVITDACGAGNHPAAKRSLDALATAGDAILIDIATITGFLARPTPGEGGSTRPEPAAQEASR